MTDAIDLGFDPDAFDAPGGHVIAGALVDIGRERIDVARASDGRVHGSVPEGGAEAVNAAVSSAAAALKASGWAAMPPRERAKILRQWADLIVADRLTLARLEALHSTRPVHDAYHGEVPFCAEAIRFFAECADKYSGDVLPTRGNSLGLIVPQPYGVVGAIAPWNFPLSMASWKIGPALAAGNAVVLKPSELTPFSVLRLAQLAVDAGMPAGVFNVVNGTGAVTGAALVRHPDIRKVSFTGSTVTGANVMADAAHHGMKPVTLELGGKSPQLVFDDAGDVAVLADRIVRGFVSNAGQACVSGSRLIVQQGIADRLLEAIVARIGTVTPGATWDAESRYAPLISRRQAMKVHEAVTTSLAAGARCVLGGGFFDGCGDGFFYKPTVLTQVDAAMPAVRDEIFGPVLTVQTFADEPEGIALAAHPLYGLAAGVHTQDISRALRATRDIAAGTVWVNRYGRTGDFIVPTGGFNGSGIGKDLGRQAFEANLRYKSVLIDF